MRTIGDHELLARIGRGGMGEVWRARHRGLDRLVAIKQIAGELQSEPAAVERFLREARAAAALRSPHTIRVHDLGLAPDGSFYQVMELLTGYDLQALVEQAGPLPPERVVVLLRQACDALSEAHAQGMVHRDIKPSNLFLSRAGTQVDHLTVLDFGLAQRAEVNRDALLTQTGAMLGSPAYFSPELLRGSGASDRSDVYALGAVAWWLLTGRLVFEARSSIELIVAHLEREPGALPGVPDALATLVRACLAKDPAARPSAQELFVRLGALDLPAWSESRAAEWWDTNPPPPPRELPDPPAALPSPVSPATLKAARERAYLDLRRHFEQSRIDLGELERRMATAGTATTEAAVQAVLNGLEPPQLPVPVPAAAPHLPAPVAAPPIVALFGGTERTGPWAPAPNTRVIAAFGGVDLDLRDAVLAPVTEIQCYAVFGGIDLIVPPELRVQVEGIGILGGFSGHHSEGDGPLVRITGVAMFGGVSVEVRPRRSATPIADAVARGAEVLQQVADGLEKGRRRKLR